MFQPKTRKEAEEFLYGAHSLVYFNPDQCAWQMEDYHQCLRKPGKGADDLYCWQHAKKVEEENEN